MKNTNKLSAYLLALLLGMPLLADAQTADSTGDARLTGVTTTTPPDSWVSPPITDTGGTIQQWLNSNAGRRYYMGYSAWQFGYPVHHYLDVTTSSACYKVYDSWSGWTTKDCRTVAASRDYSSSSFCIEANACLNTTKIIDLTPYGWVFTSTGTPDGYNPATGVGTYEIKVTNDTILNGSTPWTSL